jgi:hypothetical protein
LSARRFFAAVLLFVQVLATFCCLMVLLLQLVFPHIEARLAAYAVGICIVVAIPLYWLLEGDRGPGRNDYEMYAITADILFIAVAMLGVGLLGGDWAWLAGVLMVAMFTGSVGFAWLANSMGPVFYWASQIFALLGLACASAGMALYLPLGLGVRGQIFYYAGACFSVVYSLLVGLRFRRQVIEGGT